MNDLVSVYQRYAARIGEETGASDSLVHVHAGMLVLLIARVVTGKSLGTMVPLSIVMLAALANELLDYLSQGRLLMPDALYDMINTVFWPVVLMIGIKVRGAKADGLVRGAGGADEGGRVPPDHLR